MKFLLRFFRKHISNFRSTTVVGLSDETCLDAVNVRLEALYELASARLTFRMKSSAIFQT